MSIADDKAAQTAANRSAGRRRLAIIGTSFRRCTGRSLTASGDDPDALWAAPCAVLAHGLEADPVFFYGNRLALALFETSIEDFILMPSRLSAEPLERDERARLLSRVAEHGFIADYAGVRVSRQGRRFRIEQAVVWDLIDETGRKHGQAAAFDRWTPLDQAL